MKYSKIEGDQVVNADSIALPANLVFRPNGSNQMIVSLDVYNQDQFKRDEKGNPYYEGKPTTIKIGDVVKVVKKQDNVNGKNYWFTEGGLMIPKEKDLFKLTDTPQNVSDTPTNTTVPTAEVNSSSVKSSIGISVGEYLLINYGYSLLASTILGVIGYKIASKRKKSKFLLTTMGIGIGITAGNYASKFHFKKIGFTNKANPLSQMINPEL